MRPPTIRRSASRKNTSAGSIDSAVKARIFAVSELYCEENVAVPSGSVNCDGVAEHQQRQQVGVPAADERQDADGGQRRADSGSRIRQKKPSRVQPSITAASSSSTGIVRMNGRRMTMVTGSPNAACGIATAQGVSSR